MKQDVFVPSPHPDSYIDHWSHTGVGRIWPFPDRLFIVTAMSNPMRWRSRYHNYWKFAKHMEDSGVNLLTVELAYGDRQFEVTDPANPHHIQFRSREELWHKENLLNIGFARLPLGVKYFGYCDADITFTRADWAQEVLQQLQHYDAVQPFSSYSDLDSNHQCSRALPSFTYNYVTGDCRLPGEYGAPAVGAVGGAWCYRAEAFSAIGGLLDICILGSGDWHMAMGLAGKTDSNLEHLQQKLPGDSSYVQVIKQWQRNAQVLKRNIGYVACHAIHHWHGAKVNRQYIGRYKILVDHQYDPLVDIKRDWQGVYQLAGNKIGLRDALRAYNRSRWEDDPIMEVPKPK